MDKEKRVIVKNVIVTVLVIILFAGIILGYYNMLYTEKKNSLLKDGRTAAKTTADEVDDYLTTSINALRLTAYTLDAMLSTDCTHEDIQEYLEAQSVAVASTVLETSKGIYGYINGHYHDGSRWVPGDDYVPTERTWYKKAIQQIGSVALVEPYVDEQTGNVVMSLSKALMDNQSVVSMDIYLNKLQDITVEAEKSDEVDMAFILDSYNMVIAHSDETELGNNYSDKTGTIGSEIYKIIQKNNDGYFELNHNGVQYIVYMADIRNDWKCVTIKNISRVFMPLRIILTLTIAAVLAVIVTISILMMNRTKKQLLAEKLSAQLSSTADIYESLHEIDLIKGTITEVRDKISCADVGDAKVFSGDYQEQIRKNMTDYSDPSSQKGILDFVDFGTLDGRMRDKNTITTEFLNREKKWCRARFIESERLEGGRLSSVMFLIEDIDDEKKERTELINKSEQAMAASEAKSSFLSNMSHEIRTPINAVLGMNEMILRESTDDAIIGYASNIKAAGNSLLGLVNDILDFSKIEAGKMEIIPVEYNIASLINDLVNMIQSRADAKGLQLMLDLDKDIPQMLRGDEIRIKQVITNILTNAVKYTEKGSVIFGINAKKIPENTGAVYLDVYVKDTGMGIKQEDIKKLFSEFVRIDEKRNRNIEGTGLGMNITQRLLDMMGSSLDVESAYGIGSKFSFRLRQEVINWEPLGDYENAYRKALADRKQYKEKFVAPNAEILVTDDNEMNRIVFKSLLKKTLVKVDAAVDGDDALAFTRKKKYDIIFLDHLMPRKDGIETLKELKGEADNPNVNTTVICLTANAISGAREEYIAAGFDDYLTKPIDVDNLENVLMKYLPEDLVEPVEGQKEGEESADPEPEGNGTDLTPLNESTHIDVKKGILNTGSKDAYVSLLEVFYKSLDDKLAELLKYCTDGDIKNYTIKVHAMKSSLRLIGAAELGEEAQSLENAGKKEDLDYIRKHHEDFAARCASMNKPLSKVFNVDEADADKPEADEALLTDFYRRLRIAAENMDCTELDDIIEEMSAYSAPQQDAELWHEIQKAVDDFDYEKVIALLDGREG